MLQPLELDHFVLTTRDVERAGAFYAALLGGSLVSFGEGRRAVQMAGYKINLQDAGSPSVPRAAHPLAGALDHCFRWPGTPDEALAHLRRLGIRVEMGPVERSGARGAGTSLYFHDPDGNLVELIVYA